MLEPTPTARAFASGAAGLDVILALGIVVAGEMGYGTIPVLRLPRAAQVALADGQPVQITPDGRITLG